jgi:hypothetical protein
MSVPAIYTESTLAQYMEGTLGSTSGVLSMAAADGDFDEAVNSALLTYGQTDISQITGSDNIAKLRTLARLEAWRVALASAAGDFDFEADGGRYSRGQIHTRIVDNLARAEIDALVYLPGYQVGAQAITWTQDPYQWREDDER